MSGEPPLVYASQPRNVYRARWVQESNTAMSRLRAYAELVRLPITDLAQR